MTPWGIYVPRRLGAFGGVFELVECRLHCVERLRRLGQGGGAGCETCARVVYCLGLASLRLRVEVFDVGDLGRGFTGKPVFVG